MKPVLTPDQASALDRATQARGIPADLLMERAGRAVARAAVDVMGGSYGRRAVVVCGKGNNGGDGLVAARHLARWGVRVAVVAVEALDDLREPAASNAARAARGPLDPRAAVRSGDAGSRAAPRRRRGRRHLRDGVPRHPGGRLGRRHRGAQRLPGAGRGRGHPVGRERRHRRGRGRRGPRRSHRDVRRRQGRHRACFRARSWREWSASSTSASRRTSLLADAFVTEPADVAAVLPEREIDTHKRATGVLVVVAGSRDMTGAAGADRARQRDGSARGWSRWRCRRASCRSCRRRLAETTFLSLPETSAGTVSVGALGPLLDRLDGRRRARDRSRTLRRRRRRPSSFAIWFATARCRSSSTPTG